MFSRHFAAEGFVNATNADVFAAVDKHAQLSGHMSKSSWMMGGGRMEMTVDPDHFQKWGSHLRLSGRAFGIRIFLDEVVTHYQPPNMKVWETVGDPKLLIMGQYRMGFAITPQGKGCSLRIFIDYDLPKHGWTRMLGYVLAPIYARWCVMRMLRDTQALFLRSSG